MEEMIKAIEVQMTAKKNDVVRKLEGLLVILQSAQRTGTGDMDANQGGQAAASDAVPVETNVVEMLSDLRKRAKEAQTRTPFDPEKCSKH